MLTKTIVYVMASAGAIMSLSALVFIYIAIWNNDGQWATTSVVTGTVGVILCVIAAAIFGDAVRDRRWK